MIPLYVLYMNDYLIIFHKFKSGNTHTHTHEPIFGTVISKNIIIPKNHEFCFFPLITVDFLSKW